MIGARYALQHPRMLFLLIGADCPCLSSFPCLPYLPYFLLHVHLIVFERQKVTVFKNVLIIKLFFAFSGYTVIVYKEFIYIVLFIANLGKK